MKIYIVKGDLEFTDYAIEGIYADKVKAHARKKTLEMAEGLEFYIKNVKEYGFGGYIIEEHEVI